jgi:uncharacterized caspase-like protein
MMGRFFPKVSLAAAMLLLVIQMSVAAEPGERWAVLIGVNEYAELDNLQFCTKDAQALAEQLTEVGFPEENVFLVTDGSRDVKNLPTKSNIEARIRNVLAVAEPDDLVLVSFSGHGMHLDGKTYLCPTGARVDSPAGTMIDLSTIYGNLDRSKAARKLLWVDACRNDPRPAGSRSATSHAKSVEGLVESLRVPPKGTLTLASCAADQISWEEDQFGHGVFMHFLMEGLAGKADQEERGNGDDKISLLELYNYANIKTKRFVLMSRDRVQTPELFGRITGDFDIAEVTPLLGQLEFPEFESGEQTAEKRTEICVAAFSPRGEFLVLGSKAGGTVVWNMAEERFQTALSGHQEEVRMIRFGGKDRYVLTGGADLQVVFWDLVAGRRILAYQGTPMRALYDIALGPNCRYALSRGFDGFGVVWDLSADRELMDLYSYGFDFSPVGDVFGTTAAHRRPGLTILRARDQKEVATLAQTNSIGLVAFDPTGQWLATVESSYDSPGKLVLRDTKTYRVKREIEVGDESADLRDDTVPFPRALAFSSDGVSLLIGGMGGRIALIDVETGRIRAIWRFPRGLDVSDIQFAGPGDRGLLAHASSPNELGNFSEQATFWNVADRDPAWEMTGRVVVDHERLLAAVPTTEGDVLLFDGSTGKELMQLRGFQGGGKWKTVEPSHR